MPTVYLSPSVQDFHLSVTGENEAWYMDQLASAMLPLLEAARVRTLRCGSRDTLEEIIQKSNESGCGLHLALHTGAAPQNLSGALRGPDVYYYAYSDAGERAARIIAGRLKKIYPEPDLVMVIPNTTLPELRRTDAPAVLVEAGYRDNPADAEWLSANLPLLADRLAASVSEYFNTAIPGRF